MILRFLFAVVMAIILSACGSRPVRMNDIPEGRWKAKALIKDKEQGRSYIVYLNINARRMEKLRMDVTSALGTGVASLLVDAKEVRYALFDSKRFYFGTPQPDVMRPILAIPFDPRWLQNVMFEMPFNDKGWTCVQKQDWLSECKDSVRGLKVTWSSRQGAKRSILIEHARGTVQMNVTEFEPKVEDRKNLFVLEAPEGFQKLRVR